MNIEYTAKHYELTDPVRELVETKLEKMERFVEEPVEVRVTFGASKRGHVAEVHVSHRTGVLQGTEESETMHDAVNAVVEKVIKQARRSHNKIVDKKRRAGRNNHELHWPLEVVERESIGTAAGHKVIKSSRISIKPMTLDEAALQLDGSKNEFFVFRDSATDRVSVLYRRKDDNFGLIAPEF